MCARAASLADERLEIYAAATPPFLVVQKANGDGVDADAVVVVGAIGEGEGFDDADTTPAAVVARASKAVVAGDNVAHFSGQWEFTVVEVLAAAGQHRRSPRGR